MGYLDKTGLSYFWGKVKVRLPRRFQNKTVAVSAWSASSAVAGFGYAASVACSGVTAADCALVTFGATEAVGGNFAPVCSTGAGTVTVYAAAIPSGTVTIPTITVIGGELQ